VGGSKPFDAKSPQQPPARARAAEAGADEKSRAAVTSMQDKAKESALRTARKTHKERRFGHN
jgi:hypothetical protein